MKSVFIVASVLIAILAVAVSLLHLIGPSTDIHPLSKFEHVDVRVKDPHAAVQRFSEGLQFRTVSRSNESNHIVDSKAFAGLHAHLERSYPLVKQHLHVEKASTLFCAHRPWMLFRLP